MRDLPATGDLIDLAGRLAVADVPPAEWDRHAHLTATARAIAAREAQAGEGWQTEIARELAQIYLAQIYQESCHPGESRDPPISHSNAGEMGPGFRRDDNSEGDNLLARLATDLRNGAFETTPSREKTVRAILWRLVVAKLREANPQFLAANGIE